MKSTQHSEGNGTPSIHPTRKRSHSETNVEDSNDHRFHLTQSDSHHHGRGKHANVTSTNETNNNHGANGESSSTTGTIAENSSSSIAGTKAAPPTRVIEKSHKQVMNEVYVNLVSEMMYPKIEFSAYGFSPEQNRYPFERVHTLGYLLNPLRNRTVMEKWSPFEISIFEASITLYGKNFHTIQKYIETKTVKEIIEFYYEWKKTDHYKEWKKQYYPDLRDFV